MFGESTGKLGLKMTNRTHTNERKMVQVYYFVSSCAKSMLIFNVFINQSRYSVTTLTEATCQNFLQIKRLNIMEVDNNFSTTLLPCIVQLDYKDNLSETIVNLLDFYSLNLWRILLGGLGWSSHTVIWSGK